jgi:hypothetical protein
VGGVVVHHQVQLAVGIGPGDLLEEGEELLVAVAGLAGRGDLPGGDLQRGEQGRGAVPDAVVRAALGQPGLQRRIGAVRSSAWIWDFSSTQSTIAFSGGCKYNPTTSTTFASSCGSVENRNDSARHGATPYSRHARATVASPIFKCLPNSRLDQCVTPYRRGRPQRGRHDLPMVTMSRPTRPRLVIQPGQTPRRIPAPPADHRRPRHTDQLGDRRVRHPVRGQQHDPRPQRQPRPHRRRPRQPLQHLTIANTQPQRRGSTIRHTASSHPQASIN